MNELNRLRSDLREAVNVHVLLRPRGITLCVYDPTNHSDHTFEDIAYDAAPAGVTSVITRIINRYR